MKTLAAFAVLLVLGAVTARAEEKDEDKVAALRGELDVLEIQLDVDKTLLREAMLAAGRSEFSRMADRADTDEARKRAEVDAERLEKFIREKQAAVAKRSADVKKKAAELTASETPPGVRGARRRTAISVGQPVKPGGTPLEEKDRPGLIEKMEESQVEVQLLQRQSEMYQRTLDRTLQNLANAEFAASIDETEREKAEKTRKEFNSFKTKYVDFNKKLRMEQETLAELRNRLGLNVMGGMGGMGGSQ